MIGSDYAEAYRSLHGEYPSVRLEGRRWHVVTATGSFHYSDAELRGLTRALRHVAARKG